MKNSFSFFSLESNDKLSKLKENDINELIKELLQFKLHLRGSLNLKNSPTFGLELEFEHIKCPTIEFETMFNNLKLNDGKIDDGYHDTNKWQIKDDKTLKETNGKEITSPILTDELIYWQDLVKMCSFIKKYAKIGTHSAGHIHIGSQALDYSKDNLLNLLKIWGVYENILYRYGYNEYLNKNPEIKYSFFSSNDFLTLYDKMIRRSDASVEEILRNLTGRLKAISFSTTTFVSDYNRIAFKDTIEFRSPNGTLDPVIWQNNVNTFIKLLNYCKNNNIDMDTILKRERKVTMSQDRYDYGKINIRRLLLH